jgi:hypothetical protein
MQASAVQRATGKAGWSEKKGVKRSNLMEDLQAESSKMWW